MTTKKKRYKTLKNYPGICKDLNSSTPKFLAHKRINGKRYSFSCKTISEAVAWRNSFHPSLSYSEISNIKSVRNCTKSIVRPKTKKVVDRLNGQDFGYVFKEVWNLYQRQYFQSIEKSTIDRKMIVAKNFLGGLMDFKMVELTPRLIDAYLEKKVEEAKIEDNPRRYNFDQELKVLKAFLNWYKDNYDPMTFVNPILDRHKTMCIIRPLKIRDKKMDREQFNRFLDALYEVGGIFWRDFGECQFYFSGRVQEPAGLQRQSVDFRREFVEISNVSIWNVRSKKFEYLKERPKNKEKRIVFMNTRLKDILKRRLSDISPIPCEHKSSSTGESLDFVFHKNGQPLNYRQIQHYYTRALEKAGLDNEFSGTHFVRKAMANITREQMGLDAAQAVGGWKDRSIVEKYYSDVPLSLNAKAVNQIEKYMNMKNQDSETKPTLKLVEYNE